MMKWIAANNRLPELVNVEYLEEYPCWVQISNAGIDVGISYPCSIVFDTKREALEYMRNRTHATVILYQQFLDEIESELTNVKMDSMA